MKRIYHRHELWEDAKAGLYRAPSVSESDLEIQHAANLLFMPTNFFIAALEMIDAWPIAAEFNLSNPHRNRQAWIGQATCCYLYGCAEHQVKAAWHRLTPDEQTDANRSADSVIEIWEAKHRA